MPIQSCTLPSGKSGFKYGESGKCYASKSDALRQGKAIKVNESTEATVLEQVSTANTATINRSQFDESKHQRNRGRFTNKATQAKNAAKILGAAALGGAATAATITTFGALGGAGSAAATGTGLLARRKSLKAAVAGTKGLVSGGAKSSLPFAGVLAVPSAARAADREATRQELSDNKITAGERARQEKRRGRVKAVGTAATIALAGTALAGPGLATGRAKRRQLKELQGKRADRQARRRARQGHTDRTDQALQRTPSQANADLLQSLQGEKRVAQSIGATRRRGRNPDVDIQTGPTLGLPHRKLDRRKKTTLPRPVRKPRTTESHNKLAQGLALLEDVPFDESKHRREGGKFASKAKQALKTVASIGALGVISQSVGVATRSPTKHGIPKNVARRSLATLGVRAARSQGRPEMVGKFRRELRKDSLKTAANAALSGSVALAGTKVGNREGLDDDEPQNLTRRQAITGLTVTAAGVALGARHGRKVSKPVPIQKLDQSLRQAPFQRRARQRQSTGFTSPAGFSRPAISNKRPRLESMNHKVTTGLALLEQGNNHQDNLLEFAPIFGAARAGGAIGARSFHRGITSPKAFAKRVKATQLARRDKNFGRKLRKAPAKLFSKSLTGFAKIAGL